MCAVMYSPEGAPCLCVRWKGNKTGTQYLGGLERWSPNVRVDGRVKSVRLQSSPRASCCHPSVRCQGNSKLELDFLLLGLRSREYLQKLSVHGSFRQSYELKVILCNHWSLSSYGDNCVTLS